MLNGATASIGCLSRLHRACHSLLLVAAFECDKTLNEQRD